MSVMLCVVLSRLCIVTLHSYIVLVYLFFCRPINDSGFRIHMIPGPC